MQFKSFCLVSALLLSAPELSLTEEEHEGHEHDQGGLPVTALEINNGWKQVAPEDLTPSLQETIGQAVSEQEECGSLEIGSIYRHTHMFTAHVVCDGKDKWADIHIESGKNEARSVSDQPNSHVKKLTLETAQDLLAREPNSPLLLREQCGFKGDPVPVKIQYVEIATGVQYMIEVEDSDPASEAGNCFLPIYEYKIIEGGQPFIVTLPFQDAPPALAFLRMIARSFSNAKAASVQH